MVVADGAVALVGAPAEFPPPGVVASLLPRVERRAGVGDGVFAGAAGVVTGACCWPGVAAPLAGRRPGELDNRPGMAAPLMTLGSAGEVGLESTAVRGSATRLRLDSGAELVARLAGSAEAVFDSVGVALVAAGAALAQTPEVKAMAVAVRPAR